MVPALIILFLWVALLAPGVVKWLKNHQRSTSIASFHRQLRKLEHSGPKLVEPAYRLGGQDVQRSELDAEVGPARVPRLVLVPTGASEKESTMRYDDRYEERGDRYGRHVDPFGQPDDDLRDDPDYDDPWARGDGRDAPTRAHRAVRTSRYDAYHDAELAELDDGLAMTPDQARSRRRRILLGLGGAIVGSLLLGIVSDIAVLYAVTLVSVVAMLGYLVLMYYASSVGMYGNDALASITPVARSVVQVTDQRSYRFDEPSYDEDEDWGSQRVAAAR